ncbi:M15 family metallopeptidase [Aidingimonas halophila]|uniref:D-alanyl-D-alanine dipeptidase n=1 Tax=Aidingimonas halophila TaxID=574349 RepID=A0A1H2WRX4_9GAMM|nr:M15 family metallopeptidase [Aidingimonas halophila]GHC27480.1 D-alanyl-D-alanine dipeptidase [Aidingimonas halophila]SDW83305.1 D-alanyl-D-alanine dipeptidase [Aidingimonas halophila]
MTEPDANDHPVLPACPVIPSREHPDWAVVARIPIDASNEPLVPVSLAPEPIKVFPAYAHGGLPGAVGECYLRESVYRRLLRAARSLPTGFGLVVLDGWRPWRVQQYLFDTLYATIQDKHSELDEAELMRRTREFVSLPSRDPSAPSPHLTGGAVDVTLCDADGLMLDMGTAFDEAMPGSHADYLETLTTLDTRQRQARDRRRLLYHAMLAEGFTNLPSEWWHFDYGDQLWAHYSGHSRAHYGPTEPETIESRWRRQL